jgi:hypothetical protein
VSDQVTGVLPVLTALGGIAVTGIFSLVKGRQDKGPTVDAIWKRLDRLEKELEQERTGRYTLLRVFRSYVARVQSGGLTDLTPEEKAQLEETATPRTDQERVER